MPLIVNCFMDHMIQIVTLNKNSIERTLVSEAVVEGRNYLFYELKSDKTNVFPRERGMLLI